MTKETNPNPTDATALAWGDTLQLGERSIAVEPASGWVVTDGEVWAKCRSNIVYDCVADGIAGGSRDVRVNSAPLLPPSAPLTTGQAWKSLCAIAVRADPCFPSQGDRIFLWRYGTDGSQLNVAAIWAETTWPNEIKVHFTADLDTDDDPDVLDLASNRLHVLRDWASRINQTAGGAKE